MEQALNHTWTQALSWVMTQPGLIEGLPGGHQALLEKDDARLSHLLERNHDGLITLVSGPRGHKVGIAFEALILWGLEQGLGYQCLGRDIQIQDGKRTMGALDFVLQAPDGAIEHWELAYKLFLQSDDGLEWSSWLGPRGRDRLDTKLNKMLTHQLPMSTTPQASTALSTIGVGHIDRHRAMVQGVLFSPWGQAPRRAHRAHQDAQGRWLRPAQLPALTSAFPQSRWVQRHKPMWFGPCNTTIGKGVSITAMQDTVNSSTMEYPQLWSRLPDEQHPYETMFFVVNQEWG